MGIRGLQKYLIDKVENGQVQININEEIVKFKHNKSSQATAILIDLRNLCYFVFKDNYDILCGGRYKILKEYDIFFKHLVDLGIELVFFVDGPLPIDSLKNPISLKRNNERYKEYMDILSDITDGKTLKNIIESNKFRQTICVYSDLFQIAKKYGTIIQTIHAECDIVIAEYAKKHNTLAVISNDSDFLIFEGNWKHWSADFLDIKNFKTMEFNKIALRKHLNLCEEQLPLFASLCVNDIMTLDHLRTFHKSLGAWYLFLNVANFVNRLPLLSTWTERDYNKLSSRVFIDTSSQQVKLIKDSIGQYQYSNKEIPKEKNALLKKFIENPTSDNFHILANYPIRIMFFLNLKNENLKMYPELLLNLKKKQMGILLAHKNDMNISRTIFIRKTNQSEFCSEQYNPVYPEIKVPDLMLLFDDSITKYDSIKYELLCWIISVNLNTKYIISLNKTYLAPVLTLTYLVENKIIAEKEADVFLYVIYACENDLVPHDLKHPSILDERAFQIVFIYENMIFHIRKCISAVGLNNLIEPQNFDGVFFHNKYKEITEMSNIDREEFLLNVIDNRIYSQLNHN